MAKATLPTNYQDDVLKSTMGGKRRYTFTDNSDGTKSLEDATQYDKVGSNFGAADMNKTNAAVNAAADASKIIDSLSTIASTTQAGYMAGALAVKELNQNLAGLPSVKPGITELTFAGGNATLTHNAGFPDTNYVVMFICSNVRMFPRMCTNIDGNKTTLSASAVNGSGAIAHLEGKYQVMWIVARGA